MDLSSAILNCYAKSSSDDIFVNEINNIIHEEGDNAFPYLFQILAHLDLKPDKAKDYWFKTLAHWNLLKNTLHSDTKLVFAMCDYLFHHTDCLQHPMLVEVNTFEQILNQTTHDSLTGLFNRQYFKEALAQQMALAKRNDYDLSILFIDVDDFKEINDSYGHSVGDDALKTVAAVIEKEKRNSDIAARYGGEEFVVLMNNTPAIKALILADRIRKKIAKERNFANGKFFQFSVSGGIASFPQHATEPASLMNYADSALYRSKGAGKNTITLFKEDNRRFLRVRYKQPLMIRELGFDNPEIQPGMSKDICIGGILFENQEQFPIGTKMQVSLPINNNDPLILIGSVVRVEALGPQRYDIGMILSFKDMEKIAKNEISEYLLKQIKND